MQCPKCQSDTKIVPAGISKKTDKPYDAFTSCTNRECGYTGKVGESPSQAPQSAPDDKLIAVLERIAEALESTKQVPVGNPPTKRDDFVQTENEIDTKDIPF